MEKPQGGRRRAEMRLLLQLATSRREWNNSTGTSQACRLLLFLRDPSSPFRGESVPQPLRHVGEDVDGDRERGGARVEVVAVHLVEGVGLGVVEVELRAAVHLEAQARHA